MLWLNGNQLSCGLAFPGGNRLHAPFAPFDFFGWVLSLAERRRCTFETDPGFLKASSLDCRYWHEADFIDATWIGPPLTQIERQLAWD